MPNQKWDYEVFWKEVTNTIRHEISEQEYVMWFNNMEYSSSAEEEIRLSVPSSFYKDQVSKRYLPFIEEKLFELSGQPVKISFTVKAKSKTSSSEEKKTAAKEKEKKPAPKVIKTHPRLNSEYSFEKYVIGENNSFAANAAFAISKNPGTAYNPCLIYGGVGLGKTHLIQAIGNQAYNEFSTMKIVYVTAEEFTNEFILSIKEKSSHKFKNKYRKVDILLVDDIHFLPGKVETQEELFHTFNALYDANKQMVFTCDRPVSELKALSDRLRNRFERGLNVDLQPPSFETRIAILKQKIENKNVDIPDEVIELICKNITTNVRDLEKALTKLVAYADLVNKKITLEIAQRQLQDFFTQPSQKNISLDLIQKVVADYFGVSSNDLKGKKRTKAIAFPRQVAMFISREITEYSTTEVGLDFGGRDHTTVMHACQKIENTQKTDPTLEPTIQHLIRMIREYKINN
ncbi:MAG: chromosomal replication initiator protein DnaA [Spirochaetales bacterium]|nr:chromosomal replication initiator protein DnaA [Spirochaetales bacterium]